MTTAPIRQEEATGARYDAAGMLEARRRSREAVYAIAAEIRPGMNEVEADAIARRMLKERGLLRGWHGIYVRFGANTVRYYGDPPNLATILGEDDIFVVDIGPVWQQWEGDAGDTFVTGSDPDMARALTDVHRLFDIVADAWRTQHLTGTALYAFAEAEAERLGWRLNVELGGHRVSDFPHKLIHAGGLNEAEFTPSTDLWVLEMHIRHPERPFGAFYEDILFDPPERAGD